jgi:hypothetical protein
MGHPDEDEEKEADSKGNEAEEGGVELVVGAGNFEGDDEEGEGESEDDVGEAVDAGHVGAAETETVLGYEVMMIGHRADSVALDAGAVGLDGADHAGGEGEEGAYELKYATDYDAEQAEGEEDEPDERVKDEREQGYGPAEDEEDQEEEKLHGSWLPFYGIVRSAGVGGSVASGEGLRG